MTTEVGKSLSFETSRGITPARSPSACRPSSLRVLPLRLRFATVLIEVDVFMHLRHPAQRDEVVLAVGAVVLREDRFGGVVKKLRARMRPIFREATGRAREGDPQHRDVARMAVGVVVLRVEGRRQRGDGPHRLQ